MSTKGIPLVSGVERLIRHLSENNIPMAIASNAKAMEVQFALQCAVGLNPNYFSHYVCGADDPDVKENKPSPHVYLVCAKRFKNASKSLDSCVIFEDSLRGITGAIASGMKTVFIKNSIDRKSTEFKSIFDKITVIVDSFNNFKPESVGLPPFKK